MQTFLTDDEVAEMLRCDCSTVQELLRRGELPGLKFGRSWIIPMDLLHQRLNQMALDESEKRRKDRASMRPLAVSLNPMERKHGRRKEPPKLPVL